MEILNPSPVLCLPQAMWLTYQVIMNAPGLDQDQVLSVVVPDSLRSRTPQDGAHSRRALTGLRELGLVTEDDTGMLMADRLSSASEFLRILRHRIVVPPSSVSTDYVGAPDLRAGLIWLMRQSPFAPLHQDAVQVEMPKGLFTNDTRWNGFRWWSQALGFSQPALAVLSKVPDQKAKIVPDPTEAVVDAICFPFGEPLPRNTALPIMRLLDFLRAELPVLPGHASATYDGLKDADDHGVRVLGLALSSAEQRGILTMAYQSDPSGVVALPDAHDFGRSRYVSTVTIRANE